MRKYLDYIPIEITTVADKTQKAYGKSLPDDKIISIMGRAIPPKWTVILLALGEEPWRFKDLEDQLNMYPTLISGKQIRRSRSLQRWLERYQLSRTTEKE
jgi:DNA-binding HxlR family transcriptional regulator